MKIKLFLICGCIFLGIIAVMVLIPLSKVPPKNTKDFFRKFPPHFLQKTYTTALKENHPYIAGMDSTTLYLGYPKAPLKLSSYQWDLKKFKNYTISIKDTLPIAWKTLKSHITGNDLFLMEGLTPNIFESTLGAKTMQRKNIDSIRFSEAIPITPFQFIIKIYDKQLNQQVLASLITDSLKITIPTINLEKQVDGFFCTDGDLSYNNEAGRIIYTYRYRNQFLIFDSSLNFLSSKHTIDPNFNAHITVGTIEDHGKKTFKLTSAPHVVNKKSYSQGLWLFVDSNIISKNEDQERFHSRSVIDIYELKNGIYKFSFYVPSYHGQLMTDFAFNKHTLAILYDQDIALFKMAISSD